VELEVATAEMCCRVRDLPSEGLPHASVDLASDLPLPSRGPDPVVVRFDLAMECNGGAGGVEVRAVAAKALLVQGLQCACGGGGGSAQGPSVDEELLCIA
jgi:hypothetical protein